MYSYLFALYPITAQIAVRVKYPASSLPLLVTVPLSASTPAEVFRLTQDAALAESWAMNARGG